ncbi:hypothetical protein H5410_045084 [Solanum commersonii]|uniref:Uncharacterized protein n=1 Tax=Solanum commersonii TaxID=4109 RepID=A0A9J5XA15_SOLCO|nr:hypothetical protein H5410_045084 [Solanum commersonii]
MGKRYKYCMSHRKYICAALYTKRNGLAYQYRELFHLQHQFSKGNKLEGVLGLRQIGQVPATSAILVDTTNDYASKRVGNAFAKTVNLDHTIKSLKWKPAAATLWVRTGERSDIPSSTFKTGCMVSTWKKEAVPWRIKTNCAESANIAVYLNTNQMRKLIPPAFRKNDEDEKLQIFQLEHQGLCRKEKYTYSKKICDPPRSIGKFDAPHTSSYTLQELEKRLTSFT